MVEMLHACTMKAVELVPVGLSAWREAVSQLPVNWKQKEEMV